jgi:hypothetical protein
MWEITTSLMATAMVSFTFAKRRRNECSASHKDIYRKSIKIDRKVSRFID